MAGEGRGEVYLPVLFVSGGNGSALNNDRFGWLGVWRRVLRGRILDV